MSSCKMAYNMSESKIPNNPSDLSNRELVAPISVHPFKRLIAFQLKLAIDAFRDILLSPVSMVCALMDLVERKGNNTTSYFERMIIFGRNTERKINLFEQYNDDETSVDSIISQVEDVISREYKNQNLSNKAFSTIQQILKKKTKVNHR